MTAYYNEIDKKKAAWLRDLISRNVIAYGDVDERSIEDVYPNDLTGYSQCHFFAGIGIWSYSLRQAGWPDDKPVWTGSCPCQPFSSAGKRKGASDERHLWPAWQHLVKEQKPECIFGEQVASKDGLDWLDLVQTDMEGEDYAFGVNDLCAAGFGAPHIRQRLYFVGALANTKQERSQGRVSGRPNQEREVINRHAGCDRSTGRLGDANSKSSQRGAGAVSSSEAQGRNERGENGSVGNRYSDASKTSRLADTISKRYNGIQGTSKQTKWSELENSSDSCGMANAEELGSAQRIKSGRRKEGAERIGSNEKHGLPCATNGYWRNPDWLRCRDGKWRPVKSGLEPLANGAPSRVLRISGYGDGIVAPVAIGFIESFMSSCHQDSNGSAL